MLFDDDVTLEQQLASLDAPLRARLDARGFDPKTLLQWSKLLGTDRDARNRLHGSVEPPSPSDLLDSPREGTSDFEARTRLGAGALSRGELALCVLAGGMATRMGGVVKALVDALPGRTFLDLRLAENARLHAQWGKRVPLWLMTSEATDVGIRKALGSRCDGEHIATFEQFVSLRLTPQGELFCDDRGEPSVYATGHGDLPDALRKSGLLSRFVAQGGKYVWIANLDNLGATVDAAILGHHIAQGGEVSVELVNKVGGDRGGGPVRFNGQRIITEEFRLPVGFDTRKVPVFNTNTFIANVDALSIPSDAWTYVEVEKKIGDRPAIQFERLIGEMTSWADTRFLRVPREGVHSRFLPVKDAIELERRRGEIEAVARARGFH